MFEDLALTAPSIKTSDIVWLDVNTQMDINGRPDLLPNVYAIGNSLFNLIRCPIGARGAIFEPEYGTLLYQYIHDPCDFTTATKIRITLIQAIQRWETRIILDMNRTRVVPQFSQNRFTVTISYDIISPQQQGVSSFILNRNL
jgi:phage baseplate assembly protein W